MKHAPVLLLIALSCARCGTPVLGDPAKNNPGTTGATGTTSDPAMTGATGPTMMTPPPTVASAEIGPQGGELSLNDAKATFPPGALSTTTTITIRETEETISGYKLYSKVYAFEPDGATFASPLIVEIPFSGDVATAKLFWSKQGNPNEYDEIAGVVLNTSFVAAVDHFSRGFVGELLPPDNPGLPPDAPSGVTAHAGDTEIDLSWDASANTTLYKVLRSTTSAAGPFTQLTTTTATSFTNGMLTNGSTYYYAVIASNADGDSPRSVAASATPSPIEAPGTPVATPGNLQIALTWTAPPHASSSTTYRVFRTPEGGSAVERATVAATQYTDMLMTGENGERFTYHVVSLTPAGADGGTSGSVSAFGYKAPAGFTNMLSMTCSEQISWTQNNDGTDYYAVEFNIEGGDLQPHPDVAEGAMPSFSCQFRFDSGLSQTNNVSVFVRACYNAVPTPNCSDPAEFSLMFPVGCTGTTTCP